jgi:PAS domain-containing protein
MLVSKAFASFLWKRIGKLSAESYRRASLLAIALLLSLFFSVAYAGITFLTGFLAARYLMLAAIFIFVFFLLVLNHNNWRAIAHGFIVVVFLVTVLLIFFSGSAFLAMLPWLGLTPLLSLLMLDQQWQRIWTTVCVLTVAAFFYWPVPVNSWSYAAGSSAFYQASLIIGFILLVYTISNAFKVQQYESLEKSELQNEELRAIEEELRQSMEELTATQDALSQQNAMIDKQRKKNENYLNTLINLAMCRGIVEGNKEMAYHEILSITAKAMATARVSIWRYQPEQACIECVAIYDNGKFEFHHGLKLYKTDYLPYFEAVLEEKVIIADDARMHPATEVFTASYLKPLDIYSMLDVPYIENGRFQGVICCEHTGSIRKWDKEDVLFVKSVADLICMAINAAQRVEAAQEIIDQREKIVKQHEQLARYASEIEAINESLETRVQERTAALNEQNVKLTEYAFVNAHLLRGPLSRILGLVELIRMTNDMDELRSYIDLLDVSTKELDRVVHKITDILHEGGTLNRNSLLNE